MIFIRMESFRDYLRRYPVTSVLVALNAIVFLMILAFGDALYTRGVFLTHSQIDPFDLTEPWRYVTSMFLHANFGHLFSNMIGLVIFAPPLEYLLKSKRYAVFYLLCGIGGNLVSAAMHWAGDGGLHAAVGASGAIYGVYGAFLFIALQRRNLLDPASLKTVYIILGFGIVHSYLAAGIDLWGHIGGLIAGYLLYSAMDTIKKKRGQRNARNQT